MKLSFPFLFTLVAAIAILQAAQPLPAEEQGKESVINQEIREIRDLPYTADNDPQRMLDLYLPVHSSGPRPLVILIHGGGWSAGDKGDFGGPAQEFVRRGYAAASLNYRLSDKAIFPAQINDCKAAVRWLRAHATQYGLDPERFAAGGHSAGGHLAALLAVTRGMKQFDGGDNLEVSSDVQAGLWFAGVGDFVTRVLTPGGYEAEAAADSGQSRLIGGAILEHKDKALAASPIHYVNAQSAPIIFFHGDQDSVVPVAQAVDMDVALDRAGVYGELHILKDTDHGGPKFFDPEMYQQVDVFLKKVFPKP